MYVVERRVTCGCCFGNEERAAGLLHDEQVLL